MNLNYIYAVVQIFTELTLGDIFLYITVSGRQYAHIHGNCFIAPHAVKDAFL